MKWFRLYSEIRHDKKVRALSNELFRFWVSCLCVASEQPERGVLPPCDELALDLKMRRDVVVRFVKELVVAGFLHPRNEVVTTAFEPSNDRVWTASVTFNVHAWNSRQPSRDDSAKYAKTSRKKGSPAADGLDVMRPECGRNAAVMRPSVAVELDTEREIKNTPLYPPPPDGDRTPTAEDREHIRQAEKLLAGDLRTEAFAMEIGRVAGSTAAGEGWKWLRAAERLLDPGLDERKRSWKYLCGILRGLTDADRNTSPAAAPPKRETPYERQKREMAESLERRRAMEAARAGS